MTNGPLNADEQSFIEPGSLTLDQVVAKLNEWPEDATCATQESDGMVEFWAAPVEAVKQARLRTGTGDMTRELGLAFQIHAAYLDLDRPVLARDWVTAVSYNPSW